MENGTRANVGETFQGSLFSGDLLSETIAGSADWLTLDEAALDDFEGSFRAVFDRFPTADSPNESQTEDDLIWPVLDRLGWTASLRQQNLTLRAAKMFPTDCCSLTMQRRTAPTTSPRSGSGTSLDLRWWSPSAGSDPSIAAPEAGERESRPPPRCFAI